MQQQQLSHQKVLARTFSSDLKHDLLKFLIHISSKTKNISVSTNDLISSHNKYISLTIHNNIFNNSSKISKDQLQELIKKHYQKPINIDSLFQNKRQKQGQQLHIDQFVAQVFKASNQKVQTSSNNKFRYCDRASYALCQMKICSLIIDKCKMESEFKKGRRNLMKMAAQNANVLWYLIDTQRKQYVTFQEVNKEMREFGLKVEFEDWKSLVRYFDRDSFEVLQRKDFVKMFSDDKIMEGISKEGREKRQLSLVESKIRSKLIPKTELNWFANAYIATKLQKPFMKFPKTNLSVGKKGYTPSSHHIKLAW